MIEFKDFARDIVERCELIPDAMVQQYRAEGNDERIMLYSYRLAGFTAWSIQRRMPDLIDDTDWQDAVQECMLHVPKLLANWDAAKNEFAKYAVRSFQLIIYHYVDGLLAGGTARVTNTKITSLRSIVMQPIVDIDEDDDNNDESRGAMRQLQYEEPPFGLRDPETEAMAEQDAMMALEALKLPLATQHERRARASRVRENL